MKKQYLYLLGCIVVFVGLGVMAWFESGRPNYGALWHYPLILSPIFPAIGVGFFLARFLGTLDELQQRIQLESLAFSLANTCLVALVLGLLTRPTPVSIAWVIPISVAFYGIGLWLAQRRYR